MADAKLSSLPSANVVNKGDLFYLVQNDTSLNVSAGTVFASIIDPTLAGNVLIGGNTQVLNTAGQINITTTRTDLIGGISANTNAIANGTVLPSTIYLYTSGVSATGRGLTFTSATGAPVTKTFYVTYANNKIQLSTSAGFITYPPGDWDSALSLSPFPNGLYFVKGYTYVFDVSHPTNSGNVIGLSTSIDGTNTLGLEYTANVTRNGTPGSAGANVVFRPANVSVETGGRAYLDIPGGSDGQLKIITLVSTQGGTYVVSSNIKNDVAIEFRKPGDSVMLMYTTDSWTILGSTPGFATTFSGTSDDVPEGSKLYFTNARSRASITAGDGSIIYDTANGIIKANALAIASLVGNVGFSGNTNAVPEGSLNLYFTNVRANAAVQPSIAELRALTTKYTSNVIYVAKNGDDANSGNTMGTALANIHTALGKATEWTTVFVKSGDYTLYNQPVTIPKRVALIGDNLRTTTVRPANVTQDMFYVNNACYVTGFTFRDHRSPAAVFSYNPDGSAGYISTSPYIQNSSSITTTGTGMRVNGRYVSGLRSMVCDSYTQTNEGGIGIHMLNRGYTQLVSVFTICCHIGVLCESGGFCSITNSNSSFGTYALYADGVSDPLYYGYLSNATIGQNFVVNNLSVRPNYGDSVLFANFNNAKCSRDTGLIVDSLAIDLAYGSNTQSNFAGLQYWAQTTSDIQNQQTQTIAAFTYAKNLATNIIANVAITSTYQTNVTQIRGPASNAYVSNIINTEFELIANIITGGTIGITDRIVSNQFPQNTTANILNASNLLYLNNAFIKAEVVAYVSNVYPGFFANANNFVDVANAQSKCSRDTGYLLDSVRFDLLHGGNRQAIMSGVYYYNYSSTANLIIGQTFQTAAGYQFIGNIIANILLETAVSSGYGNALLQNTSVTTAATYAEANLVLQNINLISNIITQGPGAAATKTAITYNTITNANLSNGAKIILANKEYIKVAVLDYVNKNWANISNGSGAFYTVKASTPLVANTSTITLLENITTTIPANVSISFHQGSYISASGQTMEYVGSGDTIATALPYLGGVPIQANEVTQLRGGKVFFTSTDQLGDFRIGTGLVINRVDGTISGRTFNKALFAVMTPYILAIEG